MTVKRTLKPQVKLGLYVIGAVLVTLFALIAVLSKRTEVINVDKVSSNKISLTNKIDKNVKPEDASSYLIMNLKDGTLLANKDETKLENASSLTKLLTNYVLWDYIQKGKLKETDQGADSNVSKLIEKSSKYKNELVNSKLSLVDLSNFSIINSANDATAMIAAKIGKSEKQFVNILNDYAKKEFGQKDDQFKFYTSTGLTIKDYKNIGVKKEDIITPQKDNEDGQNLINASFVAKIIEKIVKSQPKLLSIMTSTGLNIKDKKFVPTWVEKASVVSKSIVGGKFAAVNADEKDETKKSYSFAGYYKKDNEQYVIVTLNSKDVDNVFKLQTSLLDNIKDNLYVVNVDSLLAKYNKQSKHLKLVSKVNAFKYKFNTTINVDVKFIVSKLTNKELNKNVGKIYINNKEYGNIILKSSK